MQQTAGIQLQPAVAGHFKLTQGNLRSCRLPHSPKAFCWVTKSGRCVQTSCRAIQQTNTRSAVAEVEEMANNPAGRAVPRVLSIAGSDAGGGAGIQADIKTCAALGVFCTTAITALTAQNTLGVQGIHVVPEHFVEAQIKSVLSDIGADVVKTGMLPSGSIVRAICAALEASHFGGALVVDPVLVATSGDSLADSDVVRLFRDLLFPLAELVTPNLSEASCLLDGEAIVGLQDMRRAASLIHRMGPRFVLIKGGHLPGSSHVVDILFDGHEWYELPGPRIETCNTHGTGCTLASAIAAELAKGSSMIPAVKAAKHYVSQALQHSVKLQVGLGPQGPMDHLFTLPQWQGGPAPVIFKPENLLLYAVTDSTMNKRWGRSTADAVQDAIKGGATFLQIREKDAGTRGFLAEAAPAVKLAREHGVPLVINDRVDVALACDADGVHIGQSDMPVLLARSLLGPHKIIGVSCKSAEQARQAWQDGADYIGSGGVFPTNTKQDNLTIGIDGLRQVCQACPIPVVAIGGIKAHNALEVMQGREPSLKGIAVVSELFDQPDVMLSTQRLRALLDSSV